MEESSVRLERAPPLLPLFFSPSPPPPYERELLTCTIRGHLSYYRLFFHVHSSRRRMNIHRLDRYPKEIWTGFDSGSIYLLFISLHEYYYSSRIDLYRFVTVRNFRPINPLHLPRPNKSTVDVSLMKKKTLSLSLSLYARTHLIDLPTPVATVLDNLSNPSSGFPSRKSFFLFSLFFSRLLFRSSWSFHKRREVFPWNWEISPKRGILLFSLPFSSPFLSPFFFPSIA